MHVSLVELVVMTVKKMLQNGKPKREKVERGKENPQDQNRLGNDLLYYTQYEDVSKGFEQRFFVVFAPSPFMLMNISRR